MAVNKTILVVDDSQSIRELMKFALTSVGFEILEAMDGTDAIKYLSGSSIDLILTDLNMPNMDGISLIRHIRQHPSYKHTPILLVSTESQVSKKQEAREAGASGWIVKPFDQAKLLETVKKVIR